MNPPPAATLEAPPPVLESASARAPLGALRLLGVIGPAFVAAVAFVDPGNIGTNVSAGADYRYLLVWTVVAASGMATFVQYLSAKLGLATGYSLAEVCRENTRTPVRIGLWLVAELVVIMTDLAEFVGSAVALNLLFDIPLVLGGVIVAVVTMLVLRLRLRGHDSFPAVVVGLLFVVAAGFGYLIARMHFDPAAAAGGLVPHLGDSRSVLLACGIVGATVMPHAVFLHSALAGGFRRANSRKSLLNLRFLRRDVLIAMSLAGAVNLSMLLMATSLPAGVGDSLNSVHDAIRAHEGAVVAVVFAVALLASGLASACAGVFSGQTIMRGFLRRNSNVWLRRIISAAPSLVILGVVSDPTQALVLSQVALSLCLPAALIPLVVFTSRRSVMGSLVNLRRTRIAGIVVTITVVALNIVLLVSTATD